MLKHRGYGDINAQEPQEIKVLVPPRELQHCLEKVVLAVEAKNALRHKAETEADALVEVLSHQLLTSLFLEPVQP